LHSGSDISVTGISTGPLGSELLHAAAFEKEIDKVALITPFLSYAEIASAPDYQASFITSVVAGAIDEYDLPDLMAAMNPRKLFLLNPLKSSGSEYGSSETAALLLYPGEVYKGDEANFKVAHGLASGQIGNSILEWLK
jgi:hypothetical protein